MAIGDTLVCGALGDLRSELGAGADPFSHRQIVGTASFRKADRGDRPDVAEIAAAERQLEGTSASTSAFIW